MVAATELRNVLRPTVAVAYFGAFAAQALDAHPQWRERLTGGSESDLRAFEHEVRRWYPFTPLLTGRLRSDYSTDGEVFRRGGWVVFDAPGRNNDARRGGDPTTRCALSRSWTVSLNHGGTAPPV